MRIGGLRRSDFVRIAPVDHRQSRTRTLKSKGVKNQKAKGQTLTRFITIQARITRSELADEERYVKLLRVKCSVK